MTGDALIRLSGITFRRPDGHLVLDSADFELHAGERVGLIGANGAGKSTLLSLIVGLLRPAAGTLHAFGRPCGDERDFRAVRRRVGLLFQDSDDQLFCPTVAEDVAFGPLNLGCSREEAAAIVTRTLGGLGLAGFEHRITYRLSGGEKRLVALATVLAMRPEVLLLDEPTTGLDERAERRMIETLAGLSQTMVIVSHDKALVRSLCRRIVRCAGGRLEATAPDAAPMSPRTCPPP